MNDYQNTIASFLLSEKVTEQEKEIIKSMTEDEKKEAFYSRLEFGTAGMRGIIGIGLFRMNRFTVAQATEGMANYIDSLGKKAKAKGVAISYDTRNNSKVFAEVAASVLSKHQIKVFLFSGVRPVPMLSFAVRTLGTTAGIMITASHNPKEYNGYKVYGEDGAQMSVEGTAEIVKHMDKVQNYGLDVALAEADFSQRKPNDYIRLIDKEIDGKYYKQVQKVLLSKQAVKQQGKNIKIVYTPLHGSGYMPVTTIFKKMNINVAVVDEQIIPDPNFSTVNVPNPENKDTLLLAIKLADQIGADVVFGTDPDCDRLGVAIRDKSGKFVSLSGNQVGVLLCDYVLKRLVEQKKLQKNSAVIKSMVSTEMARSVAQSYGANLVEVLVGFKFIGEKIKEWQKSGEFKFEFGFEESCGYLRGTHSRDKDAVVASALFCELCCYSAQHQTTILDTLDNLYKQHGTYVDHGTSIVYPGISGMQKMKEVMEKLRNAKVKEIDLPIIAKRDYMLDRRVDRQGKMSRLKQPQSNVIYFELQDGGSCCLRPSGTEPKLKLYTTAKADSKQKAEELVEKYEKIMKEFCQ